jgi:hypothetical protein
MALLMRVLVLLALGAVQGWGILQAGWSVATLLLLFWWESLLGALDVATRLAAHARHADPGLRIGPDGQPLPSAWRAPPARAFLLRALPFALLLLALVLGVLHLFGDGGLRDTRAWWQPGALGLGAALIALAMGLGLALQWRRMLQTNGASLQVEADVWAVQMMTLQVGLLVGTWLAQQFGDPRVTLAVLVLLKTLAGISIASRLR